MNKIRSYQSSMRRIIVVCALSAIGASSTGRANDALIRTATPPTKVDGGRVAPLPGLAFATRSAQQEVLSAPQPETPNIGESILAGATEESSDRLGRFTVDTRPQLAQFTKPRPLIPPPVTHALDRTTWNDNLECWTAPDLYHRPLYFEQPNLERYGHVRRNTAVTSALSAGKFFGSVPLIPFKLGKEPPCQRTYTLGHGRPGSYHRKQRPDPGFAARGGIMQAATIVGLVFLIP